MRTGIMMHDCVYTYIYTCSAARLHQPDSWYCAYRTCQVPVVLVDIPSGPKGFDPKKNGENCGLERLVQFYSSWATREMPKNLADGRVCAVVADTALLVWIENVTITM